LRLELESMRNMIDLEKQTQQKATDAIIEKLQQKLQSYEEHKLINVNLIHESCQKNVVPSVFQKLEQHMNIYGNDQYPSHATNSDEERIRALENKTDQLSCQLLTITGERDHLRDSLNSTLKKMNEELKLAKNANDTLYNKLAQMHSAQTAALAPSPLTRQLQTHIKELEDELQLTKKQARYDREAFDAASAANDILSREVSDLVSERNRMSIRLTNTKIRLRSARDLLNDDQFMSE